MASQFKARVRKLETTRGRQGRCTACHWRFITTVCAAGDALPDTDESGAGPGLDFETHWTAPCPRCGRLEPQLPTIPEFRKLLLDDE